MWSYFRVILLLLWDMRWTPSELEFKKLRLPVRMEIAIYGVLIWTDSAALKLLLSDAGIKQGDQVVSYCHIGQQATLVYFVAKYLGYGARLYDGSFEDWSKRTELPVVTSNKQ